MASAKGPVAIRVTRPYESVDDLLAAELDTVTKTGVILIGASQRPEGAVLRFELALSGGTAVIRGEGRVTGQKKVHGEMGLALRFTRLDSKSKAVVDKAVALRDAHKPPASHRKAAETPPPEPPPEAPPPEPTPPPEELQSGVVIAQSGEVPIATSSAEIPVAAVSEPVAIIQPHEHDEHERPTANVNREELDAAIAQAQAPAPRENGGKRGGPGVVPALPHEQRESLLERLRERGKKLSPEDIARLLAKP